MNETLAVAYLVGPAGKLLLGCRNHGLWEPPTATLNPEAYRYSPERLAEAGAEALTAHWIRAFGMDLDGSDGLLIDVPLTVNRYTDDDLMIVSYLIHYTGSPKLPEPLTGPDAPYHTAAWTGHDFLLQLGADTRGGLPDHVLSMLPKLPLARRYYFWGPDVSITDSSTWGPGETFYNDGAAAEAARARYRPAVWCRDPMPQGPLGRPGFLPTTRLVWSAGGGKL